ncbi:MAG: glycosyltransferase family 39 protein [Bacteroidales bacterium]|nr:glycosyltransferase family 39 protein [Bacteroidales bacterium]
MAALTRFWHLERVPFMHDEFSALFRTRYDSFKDLVQLGVMENDSHPAGVQVFLYYWVKLVGYNEFWIKLPFVLMGIGSVWLVYIIAKQWFSEISALLSASFFAATQYPLFYSQLARPYAAGQFFVLLLSMQCFIWIKEKVGTKHIIFFGLTAVLASLMHAFSLAQAALIVATLVLRVPAQNRKALWMAIALAVSLYLPHLPVFWHQLKAGGIGGWLGAPDSDFVLHFIFYSLNYSWYLLLMVFGIIIISLMVVPSLKIKNWIARWIALGWFVIPLAVAWAYSVWRTPILQFSTLYFAFPFLVILIFSFVNQHSYKRWQYGLLVGILLIASLASLIFERQHFKLMQHQGFDQLAVTMDNAAEAYPGEITLASYSATPAMAVFYQEKSGLDRVESFSKHQSIQEFGDWLVNQKKELLGFGWTDYAPAEWELMSAVHYPYLLEENAWFNAYWRLADKKAKHSKSNNLIKVQLNPPLFFDSQKSYGHVWEPDSLFVKDDSQVFGVALKLKHQKRPLDIRLVIELRDRQTDSLVHWQAGTIQHAWLSDTASIWVSALRFSAFKRDPQSWHIRTYVWNRAGEEFEVHQAYHYFRNRHPFILGLVEPL